MQSPAEIFDALASAVSDSLAVGEIVELNDESLLMTCGAIERLGRRVDALRVAAAAEVDERSRSELGSDSLAKKKGCRNATELLERVTLASAATISRRVALGRETRSRVGISGAQLPARFSKVSEALAGGSLGVDAALSIVRELAIVRDRAGVGISFGFGGVDDAEAALVSSATGNDPDCPVACSADEARIQAKVWVAVLDPDGTQCSEERAMARRGLRLGRERDGVIPLTGGLMPEIAAKFQKILDAHLAPKTAPTFDALDASAVEPTVKDPRTTDQQRHDVFASMLDAIARSGETPSIGGAAPTVFVSVRAEDLQAALLSDQDAGTRSRDQLEGIGVGFIDGLEQPISMRTVKQFACTGGIQPVVIGTDGHIVELGSPQRCFTPHQRRAIMLRDGGCLIPGCSIPASWCEIHHVIPDAEGGPTHPDNGVLLCWQHHRSIDTSGWQIRMVRGAPQIKAPPWIESSAPWRPACKSRTRRLDELRKRSA